MNNLNDFLNNKKPNQKNSGYKGLNNYLNSTTSSGPLPTLGPIEALDYGRDVSSKHATRYLPAGFSFLSEHDPHELQAHLQPWATKLATGGARALAKAAVEVAKMPGVIGGLIAATAGQIGDLISGEDNTDFMRVAFDNNWINNVEQWGKDFNHNQLPVYVKKSVSEGNLWDNIKSMDFWSTDGADGLGFILSMLVPGMIISKAGAGAKASQLLAKMGTSQKALKATGFVGKGADLRTATLANTLFEAGVEANYFMHETEEELRRRNQLDSNDPDYISDEAFEEKMKEISGSAAWVLGANAGILLGPNWIMSKMVYGGAGHKQFGKKLFDKNGKVVDQVSPPGLLSKERWHKSGQRYGKAAISEGFWEEGMQETSADFLRDRLLDDSDKSFMEAYFDTLGSTEGQKAIFLGAVFGGMMYSSGGRKADVRQAKQINDIITTAKDTFKGVSDYTDVQVYKTKTEEIVNDKGEKETITKLDFDADGNPQLDPDGVIKRAEIFGNMLINGKAYEQALKENDTATLEEFHDKALHKLIEGLAFRGEGALEVIDAFVENSSEIQELINKQEDPGRGKIEITSKLRKKVEEAIKANEEFQNFGELIDVNHKDAQEKHYEGFKNYLNNKYLQIRNSLNYFKDKQSENQKQLSEYFRKTSHDPSVLDGTNELLKQELLNDPRLAKLVKEKNTYEGKVKEYTQQEKDFWDNKKQQEDFKNSVEASIKMEELLKEAEKLDQIVKDIDDATTLEELNKKISKEDLENPKIKELYDAKKQIIKEFDEATREQEIRNQEESQENEFTEEEQAEYEEALEEEQFEKELAEEKTRTRNVSAIQRVIDKLKEGRDLLLSDILSVEDTIAFIEEFINQTANLTGNNVTNIQKQIDTLNSLILSNSKKHTKRGKITQENVNSLKQDIRSEYEGLNILANRLRILKEQLKQLESISKDVDNQINYYNNLIADPTLKTLNKKELSNKIEKIKKKQNVLLKLIDSIKKAITKTLEYLGEYFKTANRKIAQHDSWTERKDYRHLTTEEIRDAIASNDPVLDNYHKLKEIAEQQERNILEILDDIEFLEDVKQDETRRITELYRKLQKHDDNIRYLEQLINGEIKLLEEIKIEPPKKPKTEKVSEVVPTKKEVEEATKSTEKETKPEETKTKEVNPQSDVIEQTEGSELHDETIPNGTEGIKNEQSNEDSPLFKRPKLITWDRYNNKFFDWINETWQSFERNPKKKDNTPVTFKVNTKYGRTINAKNWDNAVNIYNNKVVKGLPLSKEEISILEDHLPMNTHIEGKDNLFASVETRPKDSDKESIMNFNENTKPLRKRIVAELIKNKSFDGIQGSVFKQFPGILKVADKIDGKVPENNISELDAVKKGLVNIFDNIRVVLKEGVLQKPDKSTNTMINIDGVPVRGVGELYLMIPRADGSSFPLKLNIQKVSTEQADVLADIYGFALEAGTYKKQMKISELPKELQTKIGKQLSAELSVIKKGLNKTSKDLTVGNLIDILIWDNAKNKKTKIGLSGTGVKGQTALTFGQNKVLDLKGENRDKFIQWITETKRRNVSFAGQTKNGVKGLSVNDKVYLDYLIDNKVLNTNAVVNEPTFQGYTNIYLAEDITNNQSAETMTTSGVITSEQSQADRLQGKEPLTGKVTQSTEAKSQSSEVKQSNLKPLSETGSFDAKIDTPGKMGLYPVNIDGVSYFASPASGKVYRSSKNNIDLAKERVESYLKEHVQDNNIIEQVEQDINADELLNMMGEPQIELNRYEEKTSQKIRKSQEKVVPLHEDPTTKESEQIKDAKNMNADKLSKLSAEQTRLIMSELKDQGYFRNKKVMNVLSDKNLKGAEQLKKLQEVVNEIKKNAFDEILDKHCK